MAENAKLFICSLMAKAFSHQNCTRDTADGRIAAHVVIKPTEAKQDTGLFYNMPRQCKKAVSYVVA